MINLMLTRHVRPKHGSEYQAMLEDEMSKKWRAVAGGNPLVIDVNVH
jgi:hypothetical protein